MQNKHCTSSNPIIQMSFYGYSMVFPKKMTNCSWKPSSTPQPSSVNLLWQIVWSLDSCIALPNLFCSCSTLHTAVYAVATLSTRSSFRGRFPGASNTIFINFLSVQAAGSCVSVLSSQRSGRNVIAPPHPTQTQKKQNALTLFARGPGTTQIFIYIYILKTPKGSGALFSDKRCLQKVTCRHASQAPPCLCGK